MKMCVTHTETFSVVHRSLIHDSQTLERTQILSTGDWMSKVSFNPYSRILLSNEKKQTSITCNKMEGRQKHFIERKNPYSLETTDLHSITIVWSFLEFHRNRTTQ